MELIYRETIPTGREGWVSSRYDGLSAFSMVKQNPSTGKKVILFNSIDR